MALRNNPTTVDDCEDDTYQPRIDEIFSSIRTSKRYVGEKVLGSGSFGTVVQCRDSKDENSLIALKIANKSGKQGAVIELKFLAHIKQNFKNQYLIEFQDFFIHKDYWCIALEVMQISLKNYLYKVPDKYMDLAETRRILYHVLMGLVKLKELGIVHADIKPGNIMLDGCGNLSTLRAKIIDFGLSHWADQPKGKPNIQTLPYRSPEIFMRCLPYSVAIDAWSAGCVLGELLIKRFMFYGRCEFEIFRHIIDRQGSPPIEMIKQGLRSHLFFTQDKNTSHVRLKSASEFVSTMIEEGFEVLTEKEIIYDRSKLEKFIKTNVVNTPKGVGISSLDDRLDAVDLLEHILKLDPKERIAVEDAVYHPFFQQERQEKMNTDPRTVS